MNFKSSSTSNTTIFLPEMDQITPRIFLGNVDSGKDYKKLIENGITHILIVGNLLTAHYPNEFSYKIIEVEDEETEDISVHFKEAFDFIDTAINLNKGRVLIHCFAGASRSASFLIAYLMQKDKQPYPKVYSFVKNKRRAVNINNGFKKILMDFDSLLKRLNYSIDESEYSKLTKFYLEGVINI